MKNRSLFAALLFVSLAFAFFSLYALVISFLLPARPSPVQPQKGEKPAPSDVQPGEVVRFGSRSNDMALPNVFEADMRHVSFIAEENPETFSKPREVTIEEINALLDTPEQCPALPGYTLIGTGLAIPESESFAILSASAKGGANAGGEQVILLRIDDETDPGTVLAAVRRNLVAFKTPSGIRCLGENVGKAPQQQESRPETTTASGDFNVTQVGPNSYRLSREDLNRATANLNSLASEARIVPDRQENGFKIFSIRPGGIWQKIGVQNGDVLKSINGIELSSPDKALEAYSRLRNANKLTLDIVRRGKKESLEYTIE